MMMKLLLLLSLIICIHSSLSSLYNYDIIINTFDIVSIKNGIQFLENIGQEYHKYMETFNSNNENDSPPNMKIYFFTCDDCLKLMDEGIKKNLESLHITPIVYKSQPLPNFQIGRPDPPQEMVSYILESLIGVKNHTFSSSSNEGDHYLLSISFQKSSVPKSTKNFFTVFDEMRLKGNDILLLDKTKRFNSVSDWHDLIVVGMVISKKGVQSWLQTVYNVFMNHGANREAYTLLDPRPALLEATLRHRKDVKIKYLTHEEICAIPWKRTESAKDLDQNIVDYYNDHHKERLQDRRCSKEFHQYLEIDCEDENSSTNHVCVVIDEPVVWKNTIDRNVERHLEGKWGRGLSKEKWRQDLPDGMFDGSTRFRDALNADTPKPFCWDSGSDTTELPPDANIYHNGWGNYSKYEKVERSYEDSSEKMMSIVLLTGKQASANAIDRKMYISLSKMYYAKRHGYKFVELFSNEFSHYFVHNLYSSLPNSMGRSDYFRGIMSKILMMLQTMHSNADHEWVVWTDDDVYINPGWLFMRLDEFLADVPSNKVLVMNNYRSAFTNILFLRNNEQGRGLVYDWLAVAMSGYVQCHGFDQAALGTLIILRVFGGMVAEPFGHTCTWSEEGTTGCNEKNDWSCDFKFEKTMYRAGFRTKRADFFGMKISSFTKGCANDYIPDFHVLYETNRLPRVQCGLCTRITEVNSMGHYDGPRGGGNDVLRLGAIDNWFFGHKAEWLFYQSYLESKNCKRLDFVENCNININSNSNSNSNDRSDDEVVRIGRNFISLTDGFAFDIANSTYCRLTDVRQLKGQREKTYMKEYPMAIAIANQYSQSEWETRYKQLGSGDGRLPCTEVPGKCKAEGPDGMDTIVHNDHTEARMFDRADLCGQCRHIKKMQSNYGYSNSNSNGDRIVVDCRTVEEERQDLEQDVNQDNLI